MLLLNLLLQETIVTPPQNPDNWFQYGLAGVLAFLLVLLIKYIIQREKYDKEREASLAKQRSEMYRDDNRVRDERWIKTLEGITKTLEKVDTNGDKFVSATETTIDKFIMLVNKVMDQGNYQTQVLTELKSIIAKLPDEFRLQKNEIIDRLDQLSINYELKTKEG